MCKQTIYGDLNEQQLIILDNYYKNLQILQTLIPVDLENTFKIESAILKAMSHVRKGRAAKKARQDRAQERTKKKKAELNK